MKVLTQHLLDNVVIEQGKRTLFACIRTQEVLYLYDNQLCKNIKISKERFVRLAQKHNIPLYTNNMSMHFKTEFK